MLSITIPETFLQEREYAIHVLVHEYLGLNYTLTADASATGYLFKYESRHFRIQDHFFNKFPNGFLTQAAIPAQSTFTLHPGLDRIVCIYGTDEFQSGAVTECGVDLIAGTFFMLTRWEEFVDQTRDAHGRFPATASLAMRSGFLDRPIVNEYAALLRKWLLQLGVPSTAFKTWSSTISIQCDVDTALYYPTQLSFVRKVLFRLIKQRSLSQAFDEIVQYRSYLKSGRDPYDTYDILMRLAERINSKASFFFIAKGDPELDTVQLLSKMHVKSICDRIEAQGHCTGIHFSYRTMDDSQRMQDEAKAFHRITGRAANNSRQHYLRCETPLTWRHWESSGIRRDYTLGYPERPGFRCGTCLPFPLFDFEQRRRLEVYEHPLIAMDVTFLFYLNATPESCVKQCKDLLRTVQRHGGEFVILWHNSSFSGEWKGWENVLEELIGQAVAK